MSNSKLEILQQIFGDYSKTGEEYLFFCPVCNHHKRKLSINIEKDKFKCWICSTYGKSIFILIKKYGDKFQISKWRDIIGEHNLCDIDFECLLNPHEEEKPEIILTLPEEFVSLVGNVTSGSLQARKYLKDRRVFEPDIRYYKPGFCFDGLYNNRIIFPSFNENGDINYFVARSYIYDNFKKYMNPPIYKNFIFNQLYMDFQEPVILTEGIFDAIIAGENSIPLLGSTISEKSKLFREIMKYNSLVYLALDPDAKEKELSIMQKFLTYGIKLYKIIIEPFKDVGEMTRDEFNSRKKEAIFIDNDKFLLYKLLNQI